jgi:transposase InsO family protein
MRCRSFLDRQFTAERSNQKWIADFTYIWPAEGWLYVAAVIDLFSRRVVGWSMSASMTAQLVTDALVMVIRCVAAKHSRTGWDTAVARCELTSEPGSRWCSL